MKDTLIKLSQRLGGAMPDFLLRAIWKTFVLNETALRTHGWRQLGELAVAMNIDRIGVSGQYGDFVSSPRDAVILKEYAIRKCWASQTNELIQSFFGKSGGTFFDIGANIGMTLVPTAAANEEIDCHGFEPEPTNFQNLRFNVRINCRNSNVTLYRVALFERESSLTFELSDSNLGDHRIRPPSSLGERDRRLISVPAKALDDMKINITHPFLVKIDTQGAEPFIFKGGENTLAQADMIISEWSPHLMRCMAADPNFMIKFFREHFRVGAITEDGADPHFLGVDEFANQLTQTLTSFSDRQYADVIVTKRWPGEAGAVVAEH